MKFGVLAFAGAVFLAGCNDSVTDPPVPVAAQVEVSPATVNLTEAGATAALTATVRDTEGQVISDAPVTWSSSESGVVSVSAAGVVQAQGEGTATITAQSGEAAGTAQVTVEFPGVPEPAQVVLTPDEITLSEIGATAQLTATALDADGMEVEDVEFTWASSDEDVATVDGQGLVEAVGSGSTTLTATVGDISGSAQVTVELDEPSAAEIRVSPEVVFLNEIGATAELQSTVLDAEGMEIEEAVVEWASSDEAVATVSEDGVVEASGAGTATITASSGEASGSAEVTVDPDAGTPAAIVITPDSVSLTEIGATAELTATVQDEDGTEIPGVPLMWTTSDAEVAVVSRDGVVEAVGEGSATITASIGEASGTAEVTVDPS